MQQSKPTSYNITKYNHLIYYVETYLDAFIQYQESVIMLHGDTYAAYLVLPKAHIHIAGHFYLSNHPPTTDRPKPKLNGSISNICQPLKNAVSPAEEAETGGMFLNGQSMFPIRHTLIAMDHPQPENGNPLKSDSKTGVEIIRSFMKPKRSK